jgi:hypothetical protein
MSVKGAETAMLGKKIPTKDGGTYLNHQQVEQLIRRMVFRDVNLIFTPADPMNYPYIYGYVYMEQKVMDRSLDRKTYEQAPVKWVAKEPDPYDYYDVPRLRQEMPTTLGGSYNLNRPLTAKGLARMVLNAVAMMQLHEIQENFYVDGERIFDPHQVGEILADNLRAVDLTGYE